MNVREITQIESLEELRPAWSRLLEQTPAANFFQSLDWLQAFWIHYGAERRLRVLVVYDDGELTGIVPLVVGSETTKVGRLRFMTYPLDFWGSFYGPIGPNPARTLEAAIAYLQEVRRDWDVLELRWIGSIEGECEQVEQALEAANVSHVRTLMDSTSIIRVAGTWEEFLAGRTSKWRNNYRRWQKRLGQEGEITFERYCPGQPDADPRWDLYDICTSIAETSWQGSSTTGTTLSHESVRAFLRDAHAAAARAGAVDMNLLWLDGRPVAFAYNYSYRGNVFGLRVGYDASASRNGAGNALYSRAIEDSFRSGDWRYDLGPGSFDCKRNFVAQPDPIYRISCFQPHSPRQQLLRFKRYLDGRSSTSVPLMDVTAPVGAPAATA